MKIRQNAHSIFFVASMFFLLAMSTASWTYGSWTYNSVAGTIDDGDWVLNVAVSGGNLITVNGVDSAGQNGHVDLDSPIDGGSYTLAAIGAAAFSGTDILSISLPNSLETIGNSSFYGCASLASVSIAVPSVLTTIGASAFQNCPSLTSFTPFIPDTVQVLGMSAFYQCPLLAGDLVLANPNLKSIGGYDMFSHLFEGSSITSVDMENSGLEMIGQAVFAVCTAVTNVVFPQSLKTIYTSAFYSCTSITEIVLPETLEDIYAWAFYNCSSLTNVTPFLPATVKTLGETAFRECSSLVGDLVLSNPGLKSIGGSDNNSGFMRETKITSVSMENSGIEYIGNHAFSGCTALTNAVFPQSLKTIQGNAFASCVSLTSITLPDALEIIGSGAFVACSSLTNVTPFLPETVKSIGLSAFRDCTSLAGDLVLASPELTYIGGIDNNNDFIQNSKITSVHMENSGIVTVGNNSFSGCDSLTNVVFSKTLQTVNNGAFYNCTAVEKLWFYGDVPVFTASFGSWTHLQARFYAPKGNETWEEYRDTYVEPLDSMEEGDFAVAYPGEKLPAGKFLTPGFASGANQYFCWWAPFDPKNLITILIIK